MTEIPLPPKSKRAIWPALVVAALVIGLAFLALALAENVGTNGTRVLKDPATAYKYPIFAGFVSHLGVFVLIAASAATGFASSLRPAHAKRLAAVAILSLLLAFDDMYLFHERVGPWLLGTSEEVVMLVYAIFALTIAFQFRKSLFAREQIPLVLAGVALVISMVIDMDGGSGRSIVLVEDLSKLTGYGLWSGFWLTFARADLQAS
ncbi:hypothetical protein [Cognatishimia sp. MH4019]|uniref:hypothetical protein n=1 Tax=Cognatishimia sp. MH4019 TaxID=2854030 RepID=UPI001CD5D64F|nr:hypothetical protein [Cognatishimia sp. MH4019]